MGKEIGAYEAKTKLPGVLRRVAAGECFTITCRGQPVAELRPVSLGSSAGVRQAVSLMRTLPKIGGLPAASYKQ